MEIKLPASAVADSGTAAVVGGAKSDGVMVIAETMGVCRTAVESSSFAPPTPGSAAPAPDFGAEVSGCAAAAVTAAVPPLSLPLVVVPALGSPPPVVVRSDSVTEVAWLATSAVVLGTTTGTVPIVTLWLSGSPRVCSAALMRAQPTNTPSAACIGRAKQACVSGQSWVL